MAKSGYINVDALQAQTSLEEAARLCGVQLDGKPCGKELRIDCPFHCPGDHAGRRELSVNTQNPEKAFYCHSYQCQFRGNLLTLMHGWLTGERPQGDKLRGADFNRVKQVLAGGQSPATTLSPTPAVVHATAATPAPPTTSPAPPPSVALEDHADENIRQLATIDTKFIRDVANMSPSAASYVRKHPALSFESMTKWRCGYLPNDGGGDKRGWSLRGHLLYPVLSEENKVLAWIGRDPAYEEKEREFLRLLPAERELEKPPQKHKVPTGFARGSHLFGQQASRLKEPGYREFIAQHGIIVVEGFNDVIGLDNLGIPAVGLLSNRLTTEQADKITQWAKQLANGKVTLLLDCDDAGEEGAKDALWQLTQRLLTVRLGWSQTMHGGQFKGKQPEQFTFEMLAELLHSDHIRRTY